MGVMASCTMKGSNGQQSLEHLLSGGYTLSLSMSNSIMPHDIVLNAGLTSEISGNMSEGKINKPFLSNMYGICIDKRTDDGSGLSDIYLTAVRHSEGKAGKDRLSSIIDSVYQQLFFRMLEYSDDYSMRKGIMTSHDLRYMEENGSRRGKAFGIDSVVTDGPFLCHEFALVLYLALDSERHRTGFRPFYVMGYAEKDGEKAEHCWIELENTKGERLFVDRISGVYEPMKDKKSVYFESKSGIKYIRDNGPFIARKLKIDGMH